MKRIQSVDDAKRALAAQDQILRAAYERLDPRQTITVPTATLAQWAEQCGPSRRLATRTASAEPIELHSLRC